jgi:large subunit ribosomal protein L22
MLKLFTAHARFIRYSPYKLREIADVIRGRKVEYALGWLMVYPVKRTEPIKKLLDSAVANAYDRSQVKAGELYLKEIRVDEGPRIKYFKPGAMGRANKQRKRLSHIKIVLGSLGDLDAKTDKTGNKKR